MSKNLTFMVIPHNSSRVHEFNIATSRLRQIGYVVGGSLLVLVLSVLGLLGYAVHIQGQAAEMTELRRVNQQQAQLLAGLEHDSTQLRQKMAQVDQLDGRVRKAMGMAAPDTVREKTPSRGGGSGMSLRLALKAGVFRVPPVAEEVSNLTLRMAELSKQNKVMATKISAQAQSLGKVEQRVVYFKARLAATPSILPVSGRLTSTFGWRTNPRREYHPGVDLAIPKGTPVKATAAGTVVFSGNKNGYGNTIMISHGYGYQTLYGHNSVLVAKVGDKVMRGQVIAKAGSTGYSTGPHCHYEVYQDGQRVDPLKFY